MPSSSPDDPTSPVSAGSAPSWARPRTPLPPHRLAKLANALGVSTPVPAIYAVSSPSTSYAPSPIVPSTAASSAFDFRRSPTPSVASGHTYTPAPQSSKYLLHVIPPNHLPHESDNVYDNELLPPPPTASGYHAQFRRGILVPVYPTLQSQLAAIAKEYALPSTVGLVLYLINSSAAAQANMRLGNMADDDDDVPGPRLSEDIWRHIWVRVLKAEREETSSSAARTKGLGFGTPAAQSSPSLLQDVMSNQSSLRPLLSPMRTETPQLMTPSPSTTASHSAISSRSDLDSPESATSVSDGGNADDVPLPGLSSPALIPILAKVEFDIDRKKAPWYDRWKRSRRAQHAKRAESRLDTRRRAASRAGEESGAEGEGEEEGEEGARKPAVALRLVNRLQATEKAPAHLRPRNGRLLGPDGDEEDEYAQLPDSDGEDEGDEGEATARYGPGSVSGDPLADVFGTDAETWADIRAENASQKDAKRSANPNVVDLALDGAALSALPDPMEDGERRQEVNDEEEIAELLKRGSRPQLSVAIPASPPQEPRRASQGSVRSRKHVPPALNLAPSLPTAATPADAASAQLAYLSGENTPSSSEFAKPSDDEGPSDGETTHKPMRRSPLDEKREGVFYDDLNLGLESSYEYDEDDPHDRRKSQVLMMAKLDEIERNLAQFSPRRLALEDLAEETPTGMPSIASSLTPPSWRGTMPAGGPPTPTPSAKPGPAPEGASWPAVPYSALSAMGGAGAGSDSEHPKEDDIPSPPRIAFNGISTELPKSPFMKRTAEDVISDETLARQRELQEEQDALYPPLVAPSLLRNNTSDSPVIPLSPDPFGRFPSDLESIPPLEEDLSGHRPAAKKTAGLRHAHNNKSSSGMSDAPSSRFSLDSMGSDEVQSPSLAVGPTPKISKSGSIMSVKGIKKLWRRTNKSSVSGAASPSLPDSGRTSPNSAPAGKRSSRTMSRSPQPGQPMPPHSAPGQAPLQAKRKNSLHAFQFNQESPYPIHPLPPRGPSPTTNSVPATTPPLPASAPAGMAQGEKGTRKSILKSFKSQSGSLSTHSSSSSIAQTPRSSSEMAQEQRRRKGSVVELGSVMKRASGVTASSMTLVDIPRSPALPEHLAGTQSRSASRQSQLSNASGRMSAASRHQRPSISSTDSASSRAPSRLMAAGASPPRNGAGTLGVPRTSGDSYDSRPSLDESQFEIVSPKLAPAQALSYPYHGLDQSMSSSE
ncbi:hypothetical protein C8Q77DRAFT_1069770 [Trametes polyzona]|nr:hypothetical protein C8Q77DRAFT_1069770 [Trametes polyzona]